METLKGHITTTSQSRLDCYFTRWIGCVRPSPPLWCRKVRRRVRVSVRLRRKPDSCVCVFGEVVVKKYKRQFNPNEKNALKRGSMKMVYCVFHKLHLILKNYYLKHQYFGFLLFWWLRQSSLTTSVLIFFYIQSDLEFYFEKFLGYNRLTFENM